MKRKIYTAACIALALVFVGSAAMVVLTLYRYRQADRLYEDLQNKYVAAESAPQAQGEDDLPQEPVETAPIRVDFASLRQDNGDVAGWLYCEGTPVNYPVVQSRDNEDYLHSDLNGKYLYSGTLFIDYRCADIGTDQNHIIYGHHMKNGTMFGTLVRYKEQAYYDEHPVLYYLTPDQDYKIELFAGFVTRSDSEVYRPNFSGRDDFDRFLQDIRSKSTFSSDVAVAGDDGIVTLSTCSYEFDNARYVAIGKLTALS